MFVTRRVLVEIQADTRLAAERVVTKVIEQSERTVARYGGTLLSSRVFWPDPPPGWWVRPRPSPLRAPTPGGYRRG